MTTLIATVLALAVGLGSALMPLINAEAYALVTAAGASPSLVMLVVLALALGQTLGKAVLFEASRRGTRWLPKRRRQPSARAARWAERVGGWLRSRRTGPAVVLASAAAGVPPLAVVSIVAGAVGQRRSVFIPLCLLGRLTRFTVLVLPVAHVRS